MPIELLTLNDLEKFKNELLHEITLVVQSKAPIEKKLLKTKDVCQILRVKPGTVQNLRKKKILRFRKIGGTIYYNYEDIYAMLK